jgi:flagellar motor switch protein FliG
MLTPIEKTALTLLGMGEDSAAKVLKYFDQYQIQAISNAMTSLSTVNSEQANEVLTEFFESYGKHSGIKAASKDFLQSTLEKSVGGDLAKNVLTKIFGDELEQKMAVLEHCNPRILGAQLEHEHPQMAAIFLSLMSPKASASIINTLPTKMGDELVLKIAKITAVDEDIAEDLSNLVDRCLDAASALDNSTVDGVKQVADIINVYDGDSDRLLNLIREHSEELLEEIENLRYDFNVLAVQTERTLDQVVQAINVNEWAIALCGADPVIIEKIRASMPNRMRTSLDEQEQITGPQPRAKIDQARKDIMEHIKSLARQGDVILVMTNEEGVS